jgi:uncharacterized protein (DUF1697 family)
MRYVALLRGINVGGKNRLGMKDLAAMFAAAGCEGVSTFIQSGNVIFGGPAALPPELPQRLSGAIEKQFGYRIPVVLRSREELETTVRENPFLRDGVDGSTLHVLFLREAPDPDRIASLDPCGSPPDVFAVYGKDVYLHLPQGLAATRLTNYFFDSKLKTVSTGRNWRTVTRLLELMQR